MAIAPKKGQSYWAVIRLRGPKKQKNYMEFKGDLMKCLKRYGGKITVQRVSKHQ